MIGTAFNWIKATDWGRVGKQILLEFWFPFLVASIWTFFRISKSDFWVTLIANFSTSFFLASWATGQFFRIVRNQSIEDWFKEVLQHFTSLKEMMAPMVSVAKMQLANPNLTADARSLADAVVATDTQLTRTAELVRRQMDQVGSWYNQWAGPPALRMSTAHLYQPNTEPIVPPEDDKK
jgi:hypothetical protein